MRSTVRLATFLPLLLGASASAATTSIVFDSSYDLYRDFRITANAPALTPIQETGSTYIRHTGINAQSSFVYDLDGSGPGTNAYTLAVGDILSVSTQARFTGTSASTTHNGSFSFIFGNGTNAHLAIINFNQSGANELFRISDNTATLAGGAGTLPSSAGDGYLSGVNVLAPNTFTTITAQYEVLTATSYRVSLAVGGTTVSRDFATASLSNIQVGMRLNNPSATNLVDVNIVPEPATAGLAALGALSLLSRRRQTR